MPDENQMDYGSAVPPHAAEQGERAATHGRKAAEDLGSAAGAMADEYRGQAEGVLDDALHRVRSFQDDINQYVRENPIRSVFTALGVGFVLGVIFRH
ncbi:MAG: hypothetical protein DME65_05265 [Verrucomicrobia bacterium]|nr:MAG: hypothetical protein DME65_05265 [Verrucomicrobiota bacterium]